MSSASKELDPRFEVVDNDADDIDETLARLRDNGGKLGIPEVVRNEDAYRLCYIRRPEGLLIGIAREIV